MKTRADLYSREAAELLRIVSMYPGISLPQLCGFYPGKEDLVQTLLPQLKRQGRILQGCVTGKNLPVVVNGEHGNKKQDDPQQDQIKTEKQTFTFESSDAVK